MSQDMKDTIECTKKKVAIKCAGKENTADSASIARKETTIESAKKHDQAGQKVDKEVTNNFHPIFVLKFLMKAIRENERQSACHKI